MVLFNRHSYLEFIFLFIILSIFAKVENNALNIGGEIIQAATIGIIAITGILLYKKRVVGNELSNIVVIYLLIIILSFLWTVNIERSVVHFIQAITIILLLYMLYRNNQIDFKLLHFISLSYFVIVFCVWMLSGFEFSHKGLFISRNSNGAFLLFVSYFTIQYYLGKKEYKKLIPFLLILVVLLIFIKSRSTWLSVISIIMTYQLWPLITKSKFTFRIYIIAVFVLLFTFVAFYIYLASSDESRIINQLVNDFTGGQLFSGREDLWPQLIDIIMNNLLFGFGAGVLPKDFVTLSWAGSAHNIYIQTLFQLGVVGLVVLLVIFYRIWILIEKSKVVIESKVMAAFLVGILIHQLFEVSLTQNNFSLGLIQWYIIGTGFYSINICNKVVLKKVN